MVYNFLSCKITNKMKLTVKNSCLVKPSKPTPNVPITVSDCDQDEPTSHVPVVYFYNRPSSLEGDPSSLESIAEKLRNSLSEALVHFYPLAGRLYHIEDSGGRVKLECNSAGALFVEAESDANISDFKDFAPTNEVRSLIPPVDYTITPLHELPPLLVQFTTFSCGGFSIGLGISHTMVDGASGAHFTQEWARITRGEPIECSPFHDRRVLMAADPPNPPRFKHTRFDPLPLLVGNSGDQEERCKETTLAVLALSKVQVQKLKEMANEGLGENTKAYSRFEAVAGHIWRTLSRAREHAPEQQTKLLLQVSFRNWMRELPKGYFGNAILKQLASSQSGELVKNPLAHACSRIREAIEMVIPDYVRSALDLVKSQPDLAPYRTFHMVGSTKGAYYGNPNMEITSWLGLSLFGADFGWGKEIYFGPASLNFDGKFFVMPGRGEDGSLSIIMRLQVGHMDNFVKLFYEYMSDETSKREA